MYVYNIGSTRYFDLEYVRIVHAMLVEKIQIKNYVPHMCMRNLKMRGIHKTRQSFVITCGDCTLQDYHKAGDQT